MNKKKICKRFLLYFSVMMFLLALGCSGGGGGGDSSGDENTVIRSTTKVLDDSSVHQLASVSDDGSELTFSNTTPQLQALSPGDVIVTGSGEVAPNGLLRKVTAVSQSGNEVVVETTPASLTDAIQKGSLEINQTLTPDNISSNIASKRGVSLKAQKSAQSIGSFYLEMNDVVLYDEDENSETTNDQIRANGSISLNPSFNFGVTIDGSRLKKLTFTNTTTEEAQIELAANASILDISEKVEIARYSFTPFTVWVGYVPVVITPILTVNVGLDGQVSVGITSSVTQKATLTAGLSYDNGQWEPISNFSKDFQYEPPSLSSNAELKVYAGPQLNLMLYGVAGPYGNITGYLELDADVSANPWWNLYGGIQADVGVKFEVLDHLIAGYEKTGLIDYRKLLAFASTTYTQPGTVSGSVKNALTNTALSEVTIKVYKESSEITTGTTNSSGTYSLSVPAGSGYRIEFSKTGYITANYYDITIDANTTKYLEAVLQIDVAHSGAGNISGNIVNALTGIGVSGLTVDLRVGINVTTGAIIASTTTVSDGAYGFSNIAAGNYTAMVSGSGYNTAYFSVISIGGSTTASQNGTITPLLSSGETRIILTWGDTPYDLDSHLTGPLLDGTRFHMYFPLADANSGSTWPEYVKLDLDDTSSYGPETTTIYSQISGVYRFSIHDFSNRSLSDSNALSNSGAQVRVYRGSNLVASFNVPSNTGGTLWTVFEMNGDTITPINTMSYTSDFSVVMHAIRRPYSSDVNLMRNMPTKKK